MRAAVEDLECNLELLGLTGVEDKLQEQVSSTLATLRNAGVRVWMLTGATYENRSCCIGRRWVMLHLWMKRKSAALLPQCVFKFVIYTCNIYKIYTCIYTCTFVIYICICNTYMYIFVKYIYLSQMCKYIHVYMHVYICNIYMYILQNITIFQVYIFMYIYLHICDVYMYIYMNICMYINKLKLYIYTYRYILCMSMNMYIIWCMCSSTLASLCNAGVRVWMWTGVHESCLTYEWLAPHAYMRPDAFIRGAALLPHFAMHGVCVCACVCVCVRVRVRVWILESVHKLCFTYEWVMSHVCMSGVAHTRWAALSPHCAMLVGVSGCWKGVHESCLTYEWVMPHV